MWEVDEHKQGGVWNLRVNKGYANKLWEDLILGFIGEQFTSRDEVTGLVLNVMQNNDRLSVWMRHGNQQPKVKEVKKDLIRIMSLPHDVKLDFRLFFPENNNDSQQVQQSATKEPTDRNQAANNKPQRELKPYRVVAAKGNPRHQNPHLAPPQARDRTGTASSGLSSDNS